MLDTCLVTRLKQAISVLLYTAYSDIVINRHIQKQFLFGYRIQMQNLYYDIYRI